jgi:iron complex outermembrane receptor protein
VLTGFLLFSCFLAEAISAPAKKRFDLPTGPAAVSLKQFILQSGVQLLYVAEEVSGVTTNTVKGEFTSGDAVKRLLANTVLQAVEMENGAIAINRSSDPNGHRVAQESERDHPKPQTNPKLISRFPTP